eukprot:795132-Amphidinium_carterae.1
MNLQPHPKRRSQKPPTPPCPTTETTPEQKHKYAAIRHKRLMKLIRDGSCALFSICCWGG